MDIVGCWIMVYNFYPLICLHSQHVRLVHATFLIKNDWLTRRLEVLLTQPLSNKYNYILQPAICIRDQVLSQDRSRMLFGAAWIGRHINRCGLGPSALERDNTSESGCSLICRSGRAPCLHN